MKEEWREIKGYEGIYEISNLGRVRSVDRYIEHPRHGTQKRKGQLLRPILNSTQARHVNTNYRKVILCNNGHRKTKTIHLLVKETFGEK